MDDALRRRVPTVAQLLEETLSTLPDEVSWSADDMSLIVVSTITYPSLPQVLRLSAEQMRLCYCRCLMHRRRLSACRLANCQWSLSCLCRCPAAVQVRRAQMSAMA